MWKVASSTAMESQGLFDGAMYVNGCLRLPSAATAMPQLIGMLEYTRKSPNISRNPPSSDVMPRRRATAPSRPSRNRLSAQKKSA